MAMEITNDYSNYAANYTDTMKKSGSNATREVMTSSKAKAQEYYEQLCKKFPQININSSRGIASGGRNNIVLNLSNDCLRKMASDPDFARKIENDIAGIPAAHEQMFAKAKSDGIEIHGFAVRINADGSMQCSCSGSTRTSGSKQSASILNTEKSQKERLEKKRHAEPHSSGFWYTSAYRGKLIFCSRLFRHIARADVALTDRWATVIKIMEEI